MSTYGSSTYGQGEYGIGVPTTWPASVSETGSLADTPSAHARFVSAIAEMGALADTRSTKAHFVTVISETGHLADAPSAKAHFVVTISETGDLAEAVASPNNVARPKGAYQPVPLLSDDPTTWGSRVASALNNILAGGHNTTTTEVTLNANTTTTTVDDSRVGTNSFVQAMPLTSSAAAETQLYVTTAPGTITLNHSNSASTTRQFRLLIVA